jgi:hypothetical protein
MNKRLVMLLPKMQRMNLPKTTSPAKMKKSAPAPLPVNANVKKS